MALGSWAVAVAVAGVLALQVAGGAASARDDREPVAASAAASAPVTIQLVSSVAPTAPEAPTTTAAPTTTTTAPPPPPTVPPAEPAPRSAPTTVDTTPPPVVEAPPATDPPPPPAPAPAPAVGSDVDTAAEAALLEDHNRHRAEAGLPPLVRDACLDDVARRWAREMAADATMRHNPDLGAAIDTCIAYTAAGENVGYGPDAASIAARFWGSSAHRANIVGGYQYVGIGVVVGADGVRWTAVEFAAG